MALKRTSPRMLSSVPCPATCCGALSALCLLKRYAAQVTTHPGAFTCTSMNLKEQQQELREPRPTAAERSAMPLLCPAALC